MNVQPRRPDGPPHAGSETIEAAAILAELKAAGIEYVVTVPDIVTSRTLLVAIAADPGFRHIKVCKEDEGVGICAGLSFCGKRALLMMQSTGLMDSLNALRAAGLEYSLPIAMLVGLVGKEPDRSPEESASVGVRIVRPVLDAMGLSHCLIETSSDAALIRPAIDDAYRQSRPATMLVGRAPRISA